MSTMSKIAGLVVGACAIAGLGIAVAQGQPPNPFVSNHAIGAGTQSTHITPMGETGVLTQAAEVRVATITREPEVAVVEQPAPAQAPAPVAQAPQETVVAMGAPAEQPMPPARQDRN
ncbi:hypothetical protein [Caenimonas koreensis]|uniref:Uncharacterized protein n=1 Tax=Caenimonas koreensis DSM 17982 TaxID=1121255 RepID=A0A844BGZ4_9BURK|nr:hypothetical protein [Caenimonas koreensis]MRD49711.1 hypothetical protein [Caenimonas koreensis DSM 17982]